MDRRSFVRRSSMLAAGSMAIPHLTQAHAKPLGALPVVVSTWDFGKAPHEAAWKLINKKGSSLDACIAGVKIVEADESNHSVGIGGYPDRDGRVTLDACVMDAQGNCGGVFCVEGYFTSIRTCTHGNGKKHHMYI
jgi:N4-(beta-N-acetylglucosaminyl)-L-asparaginase